ncbi:hypothetical protein D3C71_535910 [compost metagenome]
MSDKELLDWETALRLEIGRATGKTPESVIPEKATVKRVKKEGRHVVLGISNDGGWTVTEFPHDSKAIMELSAEMEARKAAKAKGLKVHSVISNVRLK